MKPYNTIKLEEFPDVADIVFEGRKTSIGGRVERGYHRNKKNKKSVRRYLKRRDKQRSLKEIQHDTNTNTR